ncbi:hypothetical protein AB0J74_13340 [Asanoa sp. NPDC049573]|uniref:hypothetical protein n=1 Tax=Asanoa sp. NPDC049573 TaxID=3155396 RepID=UPI00342BECCE
MRYLTERFALGALARGAAIEQFLGPVTVAGRRGIRWVTLTPGAAGIALHDHVAEDLDGEETGDLDSLPPMYPDEDRAWGWTLATAQNGSDALRLAQDMTPARPDRWVNVGVAGEDYLDWVQAGRGTSQPG